MLIHHLTVENFMIHRSTSLELFPLTVFVGANNSGKSSLFDSLVNLQQLSSSPLNEEADVMGPGPYSFLRRSSNSSGQDDPIAYKLKVSPELDSDILFDYRLGYRQTDWNGRRAFYEITEEELRDEHNNLLLVDRASSPPVWPAGVPGPTEDQTVLSAVEQSTRIPDNLSDLKSLARNFPKIGKFKLDPKAMRNPSSPSKRLGYEGENLAGLLYEKFEGQLEEYDHILASLRDAVDGFRKFRFNTKLPSHPTSGLPTIGLQVDFDDSRGVVDAPNLSDGTLLLIGWITLLNLPEHHRVMMLEEPEVGLTPKATQSVFDAVIEVSQRGDGAQVLVSTHSPYFLAWSMQREQGWQQSYVLRHENGETFAETVETVKDAKARELGGRSMYDIGRAGLVDEANQILQSL